MANTQSIQSVTIQEVINAIDGYIKGFSLLQDRRVILWHYTGRLPQTEGAETEIWYSLKPGKIDDSAGPGRWGNKSELQIDLHVVSRQMADGAQRDKRRIVPHLSLCYKVIQSFQNLNLFSSYLPIDMTANAGAWFALYPPVDARCLTVGTMLISEVPGPEKLIKEEATLSSSFRITVPVVLKLDIMDYQEV